MEFNTNLVSNTKFNTMSLIAFFLIFFSTNSDQKSGAVSSSSSVQSNITVSQSQNSKSSDKSKSFDNDDSSTVDTSHSINATSGGAVVVLCKADSINSKATSLAIDKELAGRLWEKYGDKSSKMANESSNDSKNTNSESSYSDSRHKEFLEFSSKHNTTRYGFSAKNSQGYRYKEKSTEYQSNIAKFIAAASYQNQNRSKSSNAAKTEIVKTISSVELAMRFLGEKNLSNDKNRLMENNFSPEAAVHAVLKVGELAGKVWPVVEPVVKGAIASAAIAYGVHSDSSEKSLAKLNRSSASISKAAETAVREYQVFKSTGQGRDYRIDKVYSEAEVQALRKQGVESLILTVDPRGDPILDNSEAIYQNQSLTVRTDYTTPPSGLPREGFVKESNSPAQPNKIDEGISDNKILGSAPITAVESSRRESNSSQEEQLKDNKKNTAIITQTKEQSESKKNSHTIFNSASRQKIEKKKSRSNSDSDIVGAAGGGGGGKPPWDDDPNNWENKKKKNKLDELETEKFKKALEYARNPNKLRHYFENNEHDHGFDEILDKLGGRNDIAAQTKLIEEVILERMRIGSLPFEGSWNEVEVNLYGEKITVRCFNGDQVLKISTMFIKTKFKPRINKVI